jgi:hypothetical protein
MWFVNENIVTLSWLKNIFSVLYSARGNNANIGPKLADAKVVLTNTVPWRYKYFHKKKSLFCLDTHRIRTTPEHFFVNIFETWHNLCKYLVNQLILVVDLQRKVTKICRHIIKSRHEAIAVHLLPLPSLILEMSLNKFLSSEWTVFGRLTNVTFSGFKNLNWIVTLTVLRLIGIKRHTVSTNFSRWKKHSSFFIRKSETSKLEEFKWIYYLIFTSNLLLVLFSIQICLYRKTSKKLLAI